MCEKSSTAPGTSELDQEVGGGLELSPKFSNVFQCLGPTAGGQRISERRKVGCPQGAVGGVSLMWMK